MNQLGKLAYWTLFLALSPQLLQAARLHKCTDESGHVTFSDVACPSNAAKTQELQTQEGQPTSHDGDNYWSVENQMNRLNAQKAQENQERMVRRLLQDEQARQDEAQRTAEAHQKEANKLHQEAQALYRKAARKNTKKQKGEQKAIIEQARSLERQADVLVGRRETAAPTQLERLQEGVDEAKEQAQEAEEQARRAAAAATNAQIQLQFRR